MSGGSVLIKGPVSELSVFRDEIKSLPELMQLGIGEIREVKPNVFDHGRLGSSPLGDFVVQYGADIAAAATVATLQCLRGRIAAWQHRGIEEEKSEGEQTSD